MHETNDLPINPSWAADHGLLETALDELKIGVAVVSKEYRTLWASNALRSGQGDVAGDYCFQRFCGQREICSDCVVREVFERGQERVSRERFRMDIQGKPHWSQMTAKPLRNGSGDVVAALVMIVPVNEQKQAEEDSRARQARLDSIIRVAPIGIGVVVDRTLVEVNDQLCAMTGYPAHELLNQSTRLFYPSEEAYDFVGRENCRQMARDGTGSVETRLVRKDGALIEVLLRSTPLDREDYSKGIIFTALDITASKRAEEDLRGSEEKYRQVVEHAIEAIFIAQDGRIKFPNPQMVRSLGYGEDELSRGSFIEFIHPEEIGRAHV